jgi:Predicted peptidase
METYFDARLANVAAEDSLVPFSIKTEIKATKIAALQQEIWAVWQSVNSRREALPVPTQAARGLQDYNLHQWELVNENPLPYYYIQKGTIGHAKLPLFLNLHGSGPKEMELKATLAWSLRYRDSPSRYFIPQIPNEQRYRWWLKPVQLAWEKLLRLAMIDPQIDPNALYVMGISEGGYGSQRLAAFYADYFAGAGPMAGGEPLKNAPPVNFRHLAFSFQTGANDTGFGRNTLTLTAKNALDSLEHLFPGDFVHNIVLQEGKGHGIDYTLTSPWLIQYKRKPNPAQLSWVWFPMDGRYRKGFYNIAIEQSPLSPKDNPQYDRIRFDITMNKTTNTITIQSNVLNTDMTQQLQLKKGKISIFLNNDLIDLSKKVTIIYNGNNLRQQKITPTISALVESVALFADPERIYPAKIQLAL